jgi:curved DNA-binding protein CbpA
MGKSLYDILDLEEDATPSKIKSAYVRLKHQYEQSLPESDRAHVSAIQYQAISEAYAILSDIKRRELYDQRLITERQRSYSGAEEAATGVPFIKVLLLVVLITGSWLGYTKYQTGQLAKQRELQRIELEKEQVKLQQEEARLAAENARLERERLYADRQEARDRERSIAQSNAHARRYAYDAARAEEAERRRQEAEWQRRERTHSQAGPTVIRR